MISRLLRIAIVQGLDGNIAINGRDIPVYHKVPDDASKPYIEISNQTDSYDDSNKDAKEFIGLVPITIRTMQIGGAGGDLIVDLIAEQIAPIIDDLVLDNYSIMRNYLSGTQALNGEFGREYQNSKAMIYYFHIIKN